MIEVECYSFTTLNEWIIWGNGWPIWVRKVKPESDEALGSSCQCLRNTEDKNEHWTSPWGCNQKSPGCKILYVKWPRFFNR